MILERLVLENFRQFRGRQELVFSDLKERNITIVHAENGFGKTTILKALLWVLYGRDGLMVDGKEEDFESPTRLFMRESLIVAEIPPAYMHKLNLHSNMTMHDTSCHVSCLLHSSD